MATEERSFLRCDAPSQIRVLQRGFGDEIHFALKEGFQRLAQAEIGVGVTARQHRFELDEEINVAALRVEAVADGGAEKIEPANPELAAQRGNCRQFADNDLSVAHLVRIRHRHRGNIARPMLRIAGLFAALWLPRVPVPN